MEILKKVWPVVLENEWVLFIIAGLFIIAALYLMGKSGLEDTRKIAKHLEKRYDPDLPWWKAFWRRLGSPSRIKLIEATNKEIDARSSFIVSESKIQQTELAAGHAVERTKEVREHQVVTHINTVTAVNAATDAKVSPLAWDEIQKKKHETKVAIKLDMAKTDNEIRKHKEMKDIDVQVENDLANIEARLVVLKELMPYHHWMVLHDQLSKVNLEYHNLLELPSSPYRDDELKRVERMRKTLDKDTRERERKLLQAAAGQIEA